MIKSNTFNHVIDRRIIASTLALTTGVIGFLPLAVMAKPINNNYSSYISQGVNKYNNPSNRGNNNSRFNRFDHRLVGLNTGTIIPTTYNSANRILVTKEETMPLTLTVTQDVRNNNNQVIIPSGSQIVGEIRPAGGGSRFVGDTLILNNGSRYDIDAVSRVVTTTETVSAGKNTDAIWQGSLAGAGAAAILAGVTGDRRITPLEILGGASIGALGGLLLGGNNQQELISIDPKRDLTLTLRSNFANQ